jgi:NAD(P)-dependent dehydrogenase (short-subunit alcohol dehydrogenase family)
MLAARLENTIIALTGAEGRLGSVISSKLLEAGATVAAIDVRPIDGLPDSPPRSSGGATSFTADLTNEASVAQTFAQIEEQLGPLSGLIHTVGMWGGAPFAETEMAAWDTMVKVNLTTTFLCFREAIRRMNDGGGRLVAISSGQGADSGVAEQGPYSAAKAGVVRLVEAVASEYDGRITAAAVAPSMILFGGEEPGTRGVSVEAIADLCVYLCGEGGAIHNGQVIRAYGTMT